jgi:uncharacterized protein YggE
MPRLRVIRLVGLLAVGAAVCPAVGAALCPAVASADPAPPTISITGDGSVMLAPDVADLSIAVRSGAYSATAARSRANARTQRILAAIVHLGVDRGAIQTSGISLERTSTTPRRHLPPRVFYTASNSLSLHLTNVALVGPVVDAATAAGADSIDGPTFSFANPSTGRGQATQAALADARTRADAAAAAAGYHITGVQSIDVDPQDAPLLAPAAASAPAALVKAPAPTPVSPGREEVDSTVRVVYVMAPN